MTDASEDPTATGSSTQKRRLPRGSLDRDLIVSTSLRLLDERGIAGFNMAALGRALGADQSAVYRHFASKQDLEMAIKERVVAEHLDGLPEQPCWVETLVAILRQTRSMGLTHPAATTLAAPRTTGRAAERRAVERVFAALDAAGFSSREAALLHRALVDFALAWSVSDAAIIAMEEEARDADAAALRSYSVLDPATPHIARSAHEIAAVGLDDAFETALALMMRSVIASATVQCDHEHSLLPLGAKPDE
ncbi:MAG: TetR/AcrR family transcriptional regulator [Conexibacter sp.]